MTQKNDQQWPIPESVDEIEHFMKQRVGLGVSFDLNLRKLKILKKDVHIYSVSGLVDTIYAIQLVKELVDLNNHEKLSTNIGKLVENRLVNQSVQPVENLDE
jgi:stage V sporulation protein AF